MLAKRTTRNRITLPTAVVSRFPGVKYFDVRESEGEIILNPVKVRGLESVYDKVESLGVIEKDVSAAVRWVRRTRAPIKVTSATLRF